MRPDAGMCLLPPLRLKDPACPHARSGCDSTRLIPSRAVHSFLHTVASFLRQSADFHPLGTCPCLSTVTPLATQSLVRIHASPPVCLTALALSTPGAAGLLSFTHELPSFAVVGTSYIGQCIHLCAGPSKFAEVWHTYRKVLKKDR